MKLFKISNSTDPNQVGAVFPQIELDSSLKPYNVNWPNALWKIPDFGPILFELAVPDFKLKQQAILTDCLSNNFFSANPIIISEKLLQILKASEIGQYEVFPIKIINNHNNLDYFIFRFIYSKHETYIDWEKTIWSVCYQLPNAAGIAEEYSFNASSGIEVEEQSKLLSMSNEQKSIRLKKLHLKVDIVMDEAFFFRTDIDSLICTETFVQKIKDQTTGLKIIEFYDTNIGFCEFPLFS